MADRSVDATMSPALIAAADTLASRLTAARYAAILNDAEPDERGVASPERAEGLIALAQALNDRTRCALSTLRGGGNRSGADAVLTWQTGFPLAVDFARGSPRYRPDRSVPARGTGRARSGPDVALIVGDARSIPRETRERLAAISCSVIGPAASDGSIAAAVAIDTGIAGIHDSGTALRMDDVPLPLRPSVDGPSSAAGVLRRLGQRLSVRLTAPGAPAAREHAR
jgi:formylmethanofuran dehydrogenase subunit B